MALPYNPGALYCFQRQKPWWTRIDEAPEAPIGILRVLEQEKIDRLHNRHKLWIARCGLYSIGRRVKVFRQDWDGIFGGALRSQP